MPLRVYSKNPSTNPILFKFPNKIHQMLKVDCSSKNRFYEMRGYCIRNVTCFSKIPYIEQIWHSFTSHLWKRLFLFNLFEKLAFLEFLSCENGFWKLYFKVLKLFHL